MAAARACLVALALAASLLLDGAAAAAEGNARAGPLTLRQRRRQLLRQRQVRSHLKRLNKPPLATIQSPDGDIIDCVHISKQPALDHPFLKNHIIQMRPANYPAGLYDESKVASQQWNAQTITQMWHKNGMCPENTIPIRRAKEEDVLRASSIRRYGKKKGWSTASPMSVDPDMLNSNNHEHAIAYVEGDKYYGAKATINVWQPKIEHANEFSLSQLWIVGGSSSLDLNTIEAGWLVYPGLYGDYNTRLFTYWTSDAYQTTGCYNLLCSGFIQISNQIAMGASISTISNYGGDQYEIDILVWKDQKEGNWWLHFGNGCVGYWPSFLFSYLADSASMIHWGGEVVNSEPDGSHTTTQMGSGPLPGGRVRQGQLLQEHPSGGLDQQPRGAKGRGNIAPAAQLL